MPAGWRWILVLTAFAATGTEDTITLTVTWVHMDTGHTGTAVYTASWAAPKADVHSQQRFYYLARHGEVTVDQAHRGYNVCTDAGGLAAVNPHFMYYLPGDDGRFAGLSFVSRCNAVAGRR